MVSSRRDIATAMRTACVTWRQLSGFCESCARSRQPPSPNAKLSPAGEHAAAAEEYRAALHGPDGRSPARGPGRIGALNGLGLCLRSLGDFDGAIAAHKEAIELSPQDPGLRSNYAKALMQKGV